MPSVRHIKFGDTSTKQSKLQKHRQSEPGNGRRRRDPSIHATSRPWHTSSPGIKMNISTLGQIANQNPVARKYLNRMNLSEMAQKKRGIVESTEGRGYDKMGQARLHGLKHSVGARGRSGAPNQDTVDRWEAHISDRVQALGDRRGTVDEQDARDRGGRRTLHDRQVAATRGLKRKVPKRPYHYHGVNMHHKYQH